MPLITPGQVQEWIAEIESRPESAPGIVRLIAQRLGELIEKNETLLAENIALRSGERAAEYQDRIINLEYQLEILKRQLGDGKTESAAPVETWSVLVYEPGGRVFRVALEAGDMSPGRLALISGKSFSEEDCPRLDVISPHEELLFIFDTGRTVNLPAESIPAVDGSLSEPVNLDWEEAYTQPPRGGERLVFILPVARMALYEYCVQVSRRGYAKKMRETFLESCIARSNIGSGVLLPSDKTCGLALCQGDDLLVMVSKVGHVLGMPVGELPYTIEEALRLGRTDHIVSAFIAGPGASFLAVTQSGKAFYREMDWLKPEVSGKPVKKAILSKARRESGIRLVAAAAVDESHWGVLLTSTGELRVEQMGEVLGRGSFITGEVDGRSEILGFVSFRT